MTHRVLRSYRSKISIICMLLKRHEYEFHEGHHHIGSNWKGPLAVFLARYIDIITLVLPFHPALYIIFDISKSALEIIENSLTIKSILPKPPHGAFQNPKTLRDKLVHSNLRPHYKKERGVFICGRNNCDICPLGKYIK